MNETVIRAIMFVLTWNINTGTVTHAQVYGGFETLDACQAALPKVLAVVAPQLEKDERPTLFCSGVRSETPRLVAPPNGAVL